MSERSICVDCLTDTCSGWSGKRGCRHKGRREYYMVRNAVCAKAGIY
jgi:hypothetical protein